MAEADARLDVALVSAGLARSRGHARDLLAEGAVQVAGAPAGRASRRVAAGTALSVESSHRVWVGRAAGKLDAALRHFGAHGLTVRGRCLDVGASTGGFTQVLLAAGAREVVALDVGRGQLVPSVAADPRVTERSGLSIRDVRPGDLGPAFDLVVGDLSFISLRLVIPHLAPLLSQGSVVGDAGDAGDDGDGGDGGDGSDGGDVVLLIKPQFEVGRAGLTKHGVVRDRRAAARALRDILEAAEAVGWQIRGLVPSAVVGSTGNQEYLGWFSTRTDVRGDAHQGLEAGDLSDLVERVIQANATGAQGTDPPTERTRR